MLQEPRFDPWASLSGELQLFVRPFLASSHRLATNAAKMGGKRAAVVGGGNEPPGAARHLELARARSLARSRVVGVSETVGGGDEGEQQREHHLWWQ